MMETTVYAFLDGKAVAQVTVTHDEGCEPIQLAATAHAAISDDATFSVAGEGFTADELKEWWA